VSAMRTRSAADGSVAWVPAARPAGIPFRRLSRAPVTASAKAKAPTKSLRATSATFSLDVTQEANRSNLLAIWLSN
jgi:hypothetical protein